MLCPKNCKSNYYRIVVDVVQAAREAVFACGQAKECSNNRADEVLSRRDHNEAKNALGENECIACVPPRAMEALRYIDGTEMKREREQI